MPYTALERQMVADLIDQPDDEVTAGGLSDSLQDRGEVARGLLIKLMLDARNADTPCTGEINALSSHALEFANEDLVLHPTLAAISAEFREELVECIIRPSRNTPYQVFENGVLSWVTLEWDDFARLIASEEMKGRSFTNLRLKNVGSARTLLAWPGLHSIRRLDLNEALGELEHFILRSPPLPNLRELRLSNTNIDHGAVIEIADSGKFAGLETLDLSGNAFDDTLATHVLISGGLPAMKMLNLRRNDIVNAITVCSLPHPALHTIDVADNPNLWRTDFLFPDRNDPVEVYGSDDIMKVITACTRSPGFAGVSNVQLNGGQSSIWPAVLRALAKSPHARQMKNLSIENSRFGLEAMKALSPLHLTGLTLNECELSFESIRSLVELKGLYNLVALDLSNNPLSDHGMKVLLHSHLVDHVTQWSLHGCNLTKKSLSAMAATERFRPSHLTLSGNRFASLEPLKDAPFVQAVEYFSICHELQNKPKLKQLLSCAWPQLKYLDLSFKELDSASTQLLIEALMARTEGPFPVLEWVLFTEDTTSPNRQSMVLEQVSEAWVPILSEPGHWKGLRHATATYDEEER